MNEVYESDAEVNEVNKVSLPDKMQELLAMNDIEQAKERIAAMSNVEKAQLVEETRNAASFAVDVVRLSDPAVSNQFHEGEIVVTSGKDIDPLAVERVLGVDKQAEYFSDILGFLLSEQ